MGLWKSFKATTGHEWWQNIGGTLTKVLSTDPTTGAVATDNVKTLATTGTFSFKNQAGTTRGSFTDAGLWTIGSSGYTGTHVVNGYLSGMPDISTDTMINKTFTYLHPASTSGAVNIHSFNVGAGGGGIITLTWSGLRSDGPTGAGTIQYAFKNTGGSVTMSAGANKISLDATAIDIGGAGLYILICTPSTTRVYIQITANLVQTVDMTMSVQVNGRVLSNWV
jgi:hypothetical protein